MDRNLFPENIKDFHHAYLVSGIEIAPVLKLLEHCGVECAGNPDVTILDKEILSVNDARNLVRRAQARPVGSDVQYFMVACASITREAQNALLKVLEEPTGSSVFFLILPYPDMLLDTIKSRAHIIYRQQNNSDTLEILDPVVFLRAMPSARLKMVATLLPKKEGERNMRTILGFLHALEMSISEMEITKDIEKGLRALYRAKYYITDKGSSLKILLEHVALLMPQLK